ncbi:MAG: hypothetical protein LUD53_07460 [Clostridiales bacterium]|nr:hypothetical protein [Clostridiales bacterium]
MENRNYLLTNTEFVLVAAAVGITALRGFDMGMDDMNREQVVLAMQELTRRGLLENPGDGFVAAGEIGDIFAVIRDADTTLEVHKKSGRSCMFYIGKEAVKVVPSARREDTYEVSRLPVDMVWQHMLEEGWIPEKVPEVPEELMWEIPEAGGEEVTEDDLDPGADEDAFMREEREE